MPCKGATCHQGRNPCDRKDCLRQDDPSPESEYGENLPMPRYLQVVGVVVALTSLAAWAYMTTHL